MKNRVIIFDLDGVLFDTMPAVSDFHQMEYPGITHDDVKELYKGNIHEQLGKISHKFSKEDPIILQERYESYKIRKSQAPLFSGIKDLIIKLSEENHLIVNSSALAENCLPLLRR